MSTIADRSQALDPLEAAARRGVMSRLKAAANLVREDLPGEHERARELLLEAMEQLDAWSVSRGAATEDGARFSTPLIAASATPASEFLLIPFGEVRVERPLSGRSFDFTRHHAESAKRWFDQLSRKLAIDYEHQTFDRFNTRPDGLRPAAGWIGGLDVREDGLWATDVTWTQRATELLGSGEYRYFSPVIYWTDEDQSDVASLGPVALTNDPAMRGVQPLAARRGGGPAEDQGEDEAAMRAELEAAEAETACLRRQLAGQAADHFVERGLRLGKIVDATSLDWRDEYLEDPERAEARLARAPVILPPGRVLRARGSDRGEAGAAERERLARWGVEPEDLRAYEQALAAGRVRGVVSR